MNLKLIAVFLVIATVLVCTQAQAQSAVKVTKADAQKVVGMISDDKAKTQTYCEMAKLGGQIKEAKEKKDTKKVDELSPKWVELATKLGPEYVALMDGIRDIEPNSQHMQEIGSELAEGVHKLCAK